MDSKPQTATDRAATPAAAAPSMPAAAPTGAAPQRTDFLLQFFEYAHLRPELQIISKPFGELAHHLVAALPSNPERTVALRKLLESKDCAVRASFAKMG